MGVDVSDLYRLVGTAAPARVSLASGIRVQRVRCVLSNGSRFLLVQNNSRRPENYGKWSLPGGRLKIRERPRAGLRREIDEELGFRVPFLVAVGDWSHDDEYTRVFGCQIERLEPTLPADEILACAWLDYDEVQRLAAAGRTRWGFELDAISLFRRLPPDVRAATAVAAAR